MNHRPEFENSEAWHNRGYLPHYDVAHKYQMITYRLADSLPGARASRPQSRTQERKETERLLDKGYGSCVLKNPTCAQIVVDAWKFFDGQYYDLISYVVMPNHVHVLINTYESHGLSDVIHSWKSFTAHEIKKYLRDNAGETPALPAIWQEEYWDRFIRDEKHFASAIDYILENPVKAGLVKQGQDWPWSYVNLDTEKMPEISANKEKGGRTYEQGIQ